MVNVFPTILYSCMIGFVLLALTDVFQRERARQNTFLIGLLLLLLIHLGGELFIYSGAYVYAPGLAGAQLPFRVLLGPALYYYAHATMSSETSVNKKLKFLALSGPALVLLVMIPFIVMSSPAEKLALATPETRDPELWRIAVLTCSSATFLFIFYTLVFLVLALKLHRGHKKQLMERFSDLETRSLDWFRPILFVWGVVWFMYAAEFYMNALGFRWFGSGILLSLLEVAALAIFIQKALSQKILAQSERGQTASQKTREALLNPQQMETIAKKLELAMTEDKLFLQDDLSLNKLSSHVTETENHLSETFSQFLDTNFFQYVNHYRIDEAKKALADQDRKILGIAFDVGFSTKTTFNSAFKRIVGVSPSAYRKSLSEVHQ